MPSGATIAFTTNCDGTGRSARLLENYPDDAATAMSLARDSLVDLDHDVALSRALAGTLALAIGQIAPFTSDAGSPPQEPSSPP